MILPIFMARPEIIPPTRLEVPQWRLLLGPLFLGGIIFLASAQSEVAGPSGIAQSDKLGHFLVYGLFGTLVLRLFFRPERRVRHVALSVLFLALFGFSDEFHQSFTPGRSVEVADWVADVLGAFLATTAYACWPAYRELLEKPLFRRPAPVRGARLVTGRSLEGVPESVQE